MKITKYLLLILFISSFSTLRAQDDAGDDVNNDVYNSTHEVGVFLGPVFMQTDYGEAKLISSSAHNIGFGFGLSYIAGFTESAFESKIGQFVSGRVKLRLGAAYMKSNLEYDALPVDDSNPEADNFKAMQGDTKVFNIGAETEIHIFNLFDKKTIQPYFLLGGSFVYSNANLKSELPLPGIYTYKEGRTYLDTENLFSYTAGIGTRFKLDDVDLILDYKIDFFSTDRVDGLDSEIPGDKNNDALTRFNLGVVFSLD